MVFLTGDTHGIKGILERLSQFSEELFWIDENEPVLLIVTGDFGLLFEKNYSSKDIEFLSSYLSRFYKNVSLAFLSGNHENFDLIKKLPCVNKWNNQVGYLAENIFHLQTGRVYTIEEETYAIYGGALSIDKQNRVEGISWWKEEIPSAKEVNLMSNELDSVNWTVDYLLTHTAATNEITLIDFFPFTGKLADYVARDIQSIKSALKINKFHAFGHFHIDKDLIETNKIISLYQEFYKINKLEYDRK